AEQGWRFRSRTRPRALSAKGSHVVAVVEGNVSFQEAATVARSGAQRHRNRRGSGRRDCVQRSIAKLRQSTGVFVLATNVNGEWPRDASGAHPQNGIQPMTKWPAEVIDNSFGEMIIVG